ncbi:tRNA (guanine(10)-N2)-methyltransferase -like protein [Babesia sp. Xinjiang]|uniref:tRNA (guanine(10)-N2)-methyltransferase -like protein n=1 Tax=Babesia sp. Xinjiang TaxID=462227 RepID=UPI000A24182F|nr:tRNA (guanine(10)-N2)-methyltransferase -like protein [Babesia sp. Xinjiang]ORM39686.1 tRNA (guanine(10)-N2)-methyltransferase -like protein [Babesia sp. Xinjiang]
MVRLLFWMSMNPDYNELIEPELESLAELFGITPEQFKLRHHKHEESDETDRFDEDGSYMKFDDYYMALVCGETREDKRVKKHRQNVFYYATVPNVETAIAMFDRSVLIKGIIDVWTEGKTYEEILNQIREKYEHLVQQKLLGKTWCTKYNCFNGKNDQNRLVEILEGMAEIFDRAGKVDIKNPETKIAIIESYAGFTSKDLRTIYFGHYIRDRGDIGYWWDRYSLSRRPILAPTTLENMLAFIMTNLAMVKKGSVVLDPFVGSAGSLISATHFGAVCLGSDIDMRILQGWAMAHHNRNLPPSDLNKNAYTNFIFYGLPIPDMLRFDNRCTVWKSMDESSYKGKEWIDAIIADPPYGIRASAKNRRLLNDGAGDGVVDCLIETLLRIAETMLVPRGRLVFLLPSRNDRMAETLQMVHRSKLHLRHVGLQTLTGGASRFVVVLVKTNGNQANNISEQDKCIC